MRSRHDLTPRVPVGQAPRRLPGNWLTRLHFRRRSDRGEGEAGGEPCPVRPDRPLDLSGGAAAALEFDA